MFSKGIGSRTLKLTFDIIQQIIPGEITFLPITLFELQ
jgi:hypothetical protein